MFKASLLAMVIACAAGFTPGVFAESPTTVDSDIPDLERLSETVRDLMLLSVPHHYENTKHWGRTKEMWDGLKVSVDGLRIKTKRRKKQANHGTWKRYQTWLVEPRENLDVAITEMRQTEEGRIEFLLTLKTPLGAFGRLSEWRLGVQLFSFSINARAHITLQIRGDMAFALDFRHFPPDLVLDPIVRDAQIRLDDFRITRIIDFSGPLVRELGDGLHGVLQDEIDDRCGKLVHDMNKQIDQSRDKIRLSVHELVGWGKIEELMRQAEGAEEAD
jgi:hypothetical protein